MSCMLPVSNRLSGSHTLSPLPDRRESAQTEETRRTNVKSGASQVYSTRTRRRAIGIGGGQDRDPNYGLPGAHNENRFRFKANQAREHAQN